jgi:hypothetical protein
MASPLTEVAGVYTKDTLNGINDWPLPAGNVYTNILIVIFKFLTGIRRAQMHRIILLSITQMAPRSVRFGVRSRKLRNVGQSLDG